jgi:hypothetical protein
MGRYPVTMCEINDNNSKIINAIVVVHVPSDYNWSELLHNFIGKL